MPVTCYTHECDTCGVKEIAYLTDTGWSRYTVVDRSSGVGGVGWPAPSMSTKLCPSTRPSVQHLWVSVLPKHRPKPAQGWREEIPGQNVRSWSVI